MRSEIACIGLLLLGCGSTGVAPIDFPVLPPGRLRDERVERAARAMPERGAAPLGTPADAVEIDGSIFEMGCLDGDPSCEEDERPVHRVRLPAFAIDRHEVTWARYAACVDAGICDKIILASCYVWTADRKFVVGPALSRSMIEANKPVVCVNWSQAETFCEAHGGTLPTEAQWERTARGPRRSLYAWGNTPPSCAHAQFDGCGQSTREVGTLPQGDSAEGVADLGGNVWEWIADWYDDEEYGRVRHRFNPRGPWEGDVKVVRGGSFYDAESDLRASYRYGLSPDFGYSTLGFRCAYPR